MAHEDYDARKKGTITEQTAEAQRKRHEERLKEQEEQRRKMQKEAQEDAETVVITDDGEIKNDEENGK